MNVAAAAKCRHRAQQRKFRNDEIDNLRGVDAQHAFAEVKSERIRRFVIGDLKNSFVDGENDNLTRPIGFVIDVQWFARFRSRRCVDFNFEPALFLVRSKRHDAVAQWTDEYFLRINRADERHVDVTATFEVFRNTNVLHAAGRVCSEPLLRIDAVALDRD